MALAVASSTRATGGGWLEQPHEQGLVPLLPLSQGTCRPLLLSLLKTVRAVGQAASAEAGGGFGSTVPPGRRWRHRGLSRDGGQEDCLTVACPGHCRSLWQRRESGRKYFSLFTVGFGFHLFMSLKCDLLFWIHLLQYRPGEGFFFYYSSTHKLFI